MLNLWATWLLAVKNEKNVKTTFSADYVSYCKWFLCFFTQDDSVPYSFFVNESEITGSLKETLETQTLETEKVIEIVYQPQAVFKVQAVTRCTSTIPGSIKLHHLWFKIILV